MGLLQNKTYIRGVMKKGVLEKVVAQMVYIYAPNGLFMSAYTVFDRY